ncbi:hypothetical protein Tco_1335197 [Tanacetum coccineum]
MAALMKRKRQALAEQLAKERRERPLTQAQQQEYMQIFVKNQSSALYTTGWTITQVKRLNDEQLKEEFKKVQRALANTRILNFRKTLQRTKPTLEEPSFKKLKTTEAATSTSTKEIPIPADPNLTYSVGAPTHDAGADPTDEIQDVSTPVAPTISSPSTTGTPKRRQRTARKRAPKPLLDMDDQSFIKFDSGSEFESDLVTWAPIAA